ncbi:hypothetical protein PV341_28880 [Streptomyces sp. PA03-1a]|nr:hypothetical protein [Streptomyces sp. PA03-1a]
MRSADGCIWRLTDACRACVAATEHAATVPEPHDVVGVDEEMAADLLEPFTTGSEDLMEVDLYWHDGALYG